MLSQINIGDYQGIAREPRYDRCEQEDLKTAIDYMYEFKQKLAKLHPNVFYIIERMLQNPHPR